MRSTTTKLDKKSVKTKKCSTSKKKKMADLKQPIRDTISETISFVIKGKLTPIKPIVIENKKDFTCKTNKKMSTSEKANLKKKDEMKPNKITKKKTTAKSKREIHIDAKLSLAGSMKGPEKKLQETLREKDTKKKVKAVATAKIVKCKVGSKTEKDSEQKELSETNKPKAKNSFHKPKKSKSVLRKEKEFDSSKKVTNISNIDDDFKKQQTINELLKQVNEEILEGKKTAKVKKDKVKSKIKSDTNLKKIPKLPDDKVQVVKIKTENISGKTTPSEIIDNRSEEKIPKSDNQYISTRIKMEPCSDKEEYEQKGTTRLVDIQVEKKSENEYSDEEIERDLQKYNKKSKKDNNKEICRKKTHKKLKTKPKMTIMKKRILCSNNKDQEDKICKTKLFGFWNGPKRHRVASLNALAKVHCLYENESRGNMLDIIDEASKLEYAPRKDSMKLNKTEIIKEEEEIDDNMDCDAIYSLPRRTLRSVPGLRGAGKHWEMHDTSSSSDELSDDEHIAAVKYVKKEKSSNQPERKVMCEANAHKPKKRCRKQTEVVMDLKDMVVRKRMASLNASAILAASYSLERRQSKTMKSDSDSYDGSSEEYFAASDTDIKQEEELNKEDEANMIEVQTSPNKKVAVILNQDTDVTITGVYVNSTTRSTHHEGFCSIAGMQYRISATSHTQTAATAVATETLLQSSSSSAQENSNSDSLPSSSKSYTPLDALSNMQPPPGPGIQHNHPVVPNPQPMGPPQHVLPMPPHQLSPGLRHSCSSAFSSPHSTQGYPAGQAHHPPVHGESGYVHAGYYQPAGPLITVPHGGNVAPASHVQPPPPAPLTKAASLSESSPTSTTPSVASTHEVPPPPPSSTGGDSSDSEVIITSVTTAKDSIPPPPPAHHSVSYRYAHHQYPAPPPNYSYAYHSPYTYHASPTPHNPSYLPPSPHDLCYSSYGAHKYTPSYRRYLASTQYYPAPGPQDIFTSVVPPSNQNQQSQQVVSAASTASAVSGPGTYTSTTVPPGVHPPPTILETLPAPRATLVETYQPPPPPPHYYPPPTAYGPAPSCYTHSPTRAIPYMNPTYQSCPCPMQSCPKNGLTGPLTGDSKRSGITSISKDAMPLPPVALALPLEPNSITGPPSPARGSAGMPPPPSPAGATYQLPPPPTKQESQSPDVTDCCKLEKKRKARVGKAMVRSNIAAGMQQNTMLLMCNPHTQNYVSAVKREIESPKQKDIDEKSEMCSTHEEPKSMTENVPVSIPKTENCEEKLHSNISDSQEYSSSQEPLPQKEICAFVKEPSPTPKLLQPVINTVGENVKVKNMKRKISLCKETIENDLPPTKKQKVGSYKYLIKKETNCVKINNGKRKLIEEPSVSEEMDEIGMPVSKSKKRVNIKKLNSSRKDLKKCLKVTNLPIDSGHYSKQRSKSKENRIVQSIGSEEMKKVKKQLIKSNNSSKTSMTVLDNLLTRNSIDRTIDSVVSEASIEKAPSCENVTNIMNKKKVLNMPKTIQNKVTECKKIEKTRKSKCYDAIIPQTINKIPRQSIYSPKWSNGWRWEGEPYQSKVFINSDEVTVVRKCYPAMMHETGDKITIRDCVLLKAGPRKNDLPFVAKIATLWEDPDDGEMMMSLLWYYRPEHTEQGRSASDQPDEVFASRHKDSNSVACIDDKCYVLTFNEYCRYRKKYKRIEEGIEERTLPCIPNPEPYPRSHRQPPTSQISPEMVFFCRRVYDFRQKRIMKNPT